MVSSRKRNIEEIDVVEREEPTLLHRIRSQWQFANLCQWIFLFGKVVKIDDSLDTEVSCLPFPTVLTNFAITDPRCHRISKPNASSQTLPCSRTLAWLFSSSYRRTEA